jgi:hypothetical protein
LHGATVVLLAVGSAAMLSDAFGTKEIWIHQMIISLIDPVNYNNNVYKDRFLGNMYRIVGDHYCTY